MRHGKEVIMSINLGPAIKTKLNPKLYAIGPDVAAQLLRSHVAKKNPTVFAYEQS